MVVITDEVIREVSERSRSLESGLTGTIAEHWLKHIDNQIAVSFAALRYAGDRVIRHKLIIVAALACAAVRQIDERADVEKEKANGS